jgi:hypothetical protein
MPSGNRLVVTLALLIGLVAGLSKMRPAGLAEVGQDWWNLPALLREQEEGQRKLAELERMHQNIRQRMEGKERITEELIGGRKTLLQAAAEFQHLTESLPCSEADPAPFPGATMEEKYCRQVIRWVRGYNPNTSYLEELGDRLECELTAKLARPAGLAFPKASD